MFTDEQLLRSEFDTQAYLRYVLHASPDTAAAERRRLVVCGEQLRLEMQSLLSQHTDEVLTHVQATHAAQRAVAVAAQHSHALMAAMTRLRLMTVDAHAVLRGKVAELANTHAALALVRAVVDYIALVAQLQQQQTTATTTTTATATSITHTGNSSNELARTARTLHEMDALVRAHALRELDVVQGMQRYVDRVTAGVRSRAHCLLVMRELVQTSSNNNATTAASSSSSGVATPATAAATTGLSAAMMGRLVSDVNTALHCFHLLGGLARTVANVMSEHKREALRCIARDLDTEHIATQLARVRQHATMTATTTATQQQQQQRQRVGALADDEAMHGSASVAAAAAAVEEALLSCVQGVLETLVQHTRCVLLLWRVLLSRSDATTGVRYIVALDEGSDGGSVTGAQQQQQQQPPQQVQWLLDYWVGTMGRVRAQLTDWLRVPHLLAALVHAYPRLHTLLRNCVTATCNNDNNNSSGSSSSAAANAMTLAALAVRQGTMGDYLVLLEDVQRACAATATTATATRRHIHATALGTTWLREVTAEPARRFATQLLERHRQHMQALLSRLSVLTPTSTAVANQAAATSAAAMVDSNTVTTMTMTAPVEAHTLTASAYMRVALHDVHTHRREPHALHLTLQTMLVCVTQLQARVQESVAACPLPPLPAVTANMTRGQLLHLCITNLCTGVVCDLSSALTLLPPDAVAAASATQHAAGERAADDNSNISNISKDEVDEDEDAHALAVALHRDRRQLSEVAQSFGALARQSSHPFMHSAASLLLLATTQCVRGFVAQQQQQQQQEQQQQQQQSSEHAQGTPASREARAQAAEAVVGQLRVHIRHFVTRYLVAVDTRTAGWCALARRTGDALLARLLARVACATLDALCAHTSNTASDVAELDTTTVIATAATTTAVDKHGDDATTTTAPLPQQLWLLECLTTVMPELVAFVHATQAGGMARSTLLLKSSARQMQLLYGEDGAHVAWRSGDELVALLQPLCPSLARALLLQHVWWHVQHDKSTTMTVASGDDGSSSSSSGENKSCTRTATATLRTPLPRLVEGVEAAVLQHCKQATLHHDDDDTDEQAQQTAPPAHEQQQQQRELLQRETDAVLQECIEALLPRTPSDVSAVVHIALRALSTAHEPPQQ